MSFERAEKLEYPVTGIESSRALLEDFARRERPSNATLLNFAGTGGKDAYNCTAAMIDGRLVVASRVEPRRDQTAAKVFFYHQRADGCFEEIPDAPVFDMQDPAIALIGKEIIVSGVEVEWGPKRYEGDEEPPTTGYRTIFYRGTQLGDLKRFAQGPDRMKDIRLIELPDGRIGVFTRPQGGEAGPGKIAFTIINTLEDLTPGRLAEAVTIPGQFAEGEWGGANHLQILDKKTIGVLGHVASKDKNGALHYYAMTFTFDLETKTASPLRIIATREDFPPSESKRSKQGDVVFSGALLPEGGDRYTLYAGLSDTKDGKNTVIHPFGIAPLRGV